MGHAARCRPLRSNWTAGRTRATSQRCPTDDDLGRSQCDSQLRALFAWSLLDSGELALPVSKKRRRLCTEWQSVHCLVETPVPSLGMEATLSQWRRLCPTDVLQQLDGDGDDVDDDYKDGLQENARDNDGGEGKNYLDGKNDGDDGKNNQSHDSEWTDRDAKPKCDDPCDDDCKQPAAKPIYPDKCPYQYDD